MKKKEFQILIFMMFIWIALNETVRPLIMVVGIFVCLYSIRFVNRFLKVDFAKEFDVPPFKFLKYCVYIVKEIYLAGWDMLKRILSGNVKPVFIKYESDLKSDLANVVLANSITSTPGTITVHRNNNNYLILSADSDKKGVIEGVRDSMEIEVRIFDERQAN